MFGVAAGKVLFPLPQGLGFIDLQLGPSSEQIRETPAKTIAAALGSFHVLLADPVDTFSLRSLGGDNGADGTAIWNSGLLIDCRNMTESCIQVPGANAHSTLILDSNPDDPLVVVAAGGDRTNVSVRGIRPSRPADAAIETITKADVDRSKVAAPVWRSNLRFENCLLFSCGWTEEAVTACHDKGYAVISTKDGSTISSVERYRLMGKKVLVAVASGTLISNEAVFLKTRLDIATPGGQLSVVDCDSIFANHGYASTAQPEALASYGPCALVRFGVEYIAVLKSPPDDKADHLPILLQRNSPLTLGPASAAKATPVPSDVPAGLPAGKPSLLSRLLGHRTEKDRIFD